MGSKLKRKINSARTPTSAAPAQPATLASALALHQSGRVEAAEAAYRELLRREPASVRAKHLLAALLMDSARLVHAIELLEDAQRSHPGDAPVLVNLGEAYRRSGEFERAAAILVQAVQLAPDLPEASFNLGMTLRQLGEDEAALACFTRATDLAPERFEFQFQLAEALRRAQADETAVGHYQCALALAPRSLEAFIGLSMCLRALERYPGACSMSSRAIALNSSSAAGHHELGKALSGLGRWDEAVAAFERALKCDPLASESHFGLGCALVEVGRTREALQHFRRCLELVPGDYFVHSNLVYLMSFDPNSSAGDILREAKEWSRRFAEPLTPHSVDFALSREPERRLRVGYVAPTFRNHCQAFFLEPLLRHHDHQRHEIYCYSSTPVTDDVTRRLERHADVWREVKSLDDAALAELIRSDGIDILVDLNMHMEHARLRCFARRPAPVQISWLAYPGTTGLTCIDYRISDPLLDPADADLSCYSERTLYVPDAFWCYDPLCTEPAVSELPALSRQQLTFGCLNAYWKLNQQTFELWASALHAVPSARMIVLAGPGAARAFVVEGLARWGIEEARIECVARRPRAEYLQTYQQIDLCLDTVPYNGHTTSLDAFWMGVPVVTLVGERVVGRAGLCQAMQLGLPQLIAHSPSEFPQRVKALASDLPALARLRSELRGKLERSPLMDAPRFARNLEAAYRRAWREWCSTSEASHHVTVQGAGTQ